MIKSFFFQKLHFLRHEWDFQKDKIKHEEQEEWLEALENVNENSAGGTKKLKNLPFLLSWLRYLFLFLFLASPSYWISQSDKKQKQIKQGDFNPYRCVDIYVLGWLIFEVLVAIIIGSKNLQIIAFIGIFSFRLFDLFQSWISQFVLRSKWNPINVSRSLVLAFEGYIEIILIGAIIKFTFGWYSANGNGFWDALYDSVNTMIANPGGEVSPMQYVQIMFAVLFAATVIQHIVGRRSGWKGDEHE